MTDYKKYINALRKCAKEHENDSTLTGHIVVSDLCHDTANLLESLEQEHCDDFISRQAVINAIANTCFWLSADNWEELTKCINSIPPASEKLINVPAKDMSVDDMLEKLETEIKQLTSRYTVSKERGGMGQVEWSDRLIKEEDILRITNNYRTESEDD
jgi:hypothetical protein